MCWLADTPLVESGTAGYLGQVTVSQRGISECFDCLPKETPKTFPICTIRSTPTSLVHCIVWAKDYLFFNLFGDLGEYHLQLNHVSSAETSNQGKTAFHVESVVAILLTVVVFFSEEEMALNQEDKEFKELRKQSMNPSFAHAVLQKVYFFESF